MELFKEYIRERQGLEMIDKPYGFVSFRITEKECFIADMFISKEVRGSGKGRELLREVFKEALKNNCVIVTANIHLKDPNANSTLMAAQACGFRVARAEQDILLISVEFKGE